MLTGKVASLRGLEIYLVMVTKEMTEKISSHRFTSHGTRNVRSHGD